MKWSSLLHTLGSSIPDKPYHSEGRAHAQDQFLSIQTSFESELKNNSIHNNDRLNQSLEAWQEVFWYG